MNAATSRMRLTLAVFAVGAGLALFSAGPAHAGQVHPFASSFGTFSNPEAVTVDPSTGNVFAIDVGSATVQKFDASGNPVSFSAVGSNTLDGASGADQTPEGGFSFDFDSAAELAIDRSGGAADGYLYVTNSFAGVVDVFDSATGAFVGELDDSTATPQSGGEACGVATDPSGDVYVGFFSGHVDKFAPTDAIPAHDAFDNQLENVGGICNVAADGLGNVYLSTWSTGPLTKYDQSQLGQDTPSGTVVDGTSLAVAVDSTTNDVYVDHGDRVVQYDSSGSVLGQSGVGNLGGRSFGVAINGGSGQLYASDSDAAKVDLFGPAVTVDQPTVSIDQPSSVTSTHATFTGTVNPQGTDALNSTSWHFEYSTDGGSTFTSTPGGTIDPGTSEVQVSDDINTFIPNQAVQVRLVASNAGGSTTSGTISFTTSALAPGVTSERAQDITPTHAALTGFIDPHNADTTYYFEYGPTTTYGTSVPATRDADAGSADDIGQVSQQIGGLHTGTTYHFRLVATNVGGTTTGQDQTFTTTSPLPASTSRAGIPGTGFLPDDRAWEQVSPSDKNGGDVMADSSRTRAASDGSAVQFSSLAAFGDAVGTSVATDYVSTRGSDGWETHAVTPRQAPLTLLPIELGLQSLYVSDLSSDLSKGVFLGWSPVTSDPDVAKVANIYLRTDLRTPGAGSYQLLSLCPLCQGAGPLPAPAGRNTSGLGQPYVAGASADFGHVIFESQEPLTADAAGCDNNLQDTNQCPGNLYEWDHGTVRLAGILPDGQPAHGSQAGQGAGGFQGIFELTPHTISTDGSRIFFTVPSSPGERSGALYVRLDHTTTAQLNASERSSSDPNPGQPATYWNASADGSRVFFTTSEALTDDAPVNGDRKLYMYDTTKPDSDPHNLTLLSPDSDPSDSGDVGTVFGVSDDGRYVYFATGELLPGEPRLLGQDAGALYVWHDGALRFITTLSQPDITENSIGISWLFVKPYARVTPDGLHLLFSSGKLGQGPTGYDQTCSGGGVGCRELYVYSYGSQRIACASCDPTGVRARQDALLDVRTNNGAAYDTSAESRPLSDDGRRVFFSTAQALVPRDTNGKLDVYEYDVPTGTVHLITSGRDLSDSYFLNASASGDDAFFITRQALVGTDVDKSYDLYDARVGGGFPEPPPLPRACSGDACQPPESASPAAPASASGRVTGNGNVPSKAKAKPKRCRRGFVRKKVHGKIRCVKVKKPRHKARKAKHAKRPTRVRAGHGRTR